MATIWYAGDDEPLDPVMQFVQTQILPNLPMSVTEVRRLCEESGVGTVGAVRQRARELGVRSRLPKSGSTRASQWYLPNGTGQTKRGRTAARRS